MLSLVPSTCPVVGLPHTYATPPHVSSSFAKPSPTMTAQRLSPYYMMDGIYTYIVYLYIFISRSMYPYLDPTLTLTLTLILTPTLTPTLTLTPALTL